MSRSATPSTWNAVDSPMRGEKRSSPHASSSCGSAPSNSTASSPASSSSISSIMRAPRRRRLPPGGARLRRRLTPLAAPGSPGPYCSYCPLRPGTASDARGTRISCCLPGPCGLEPGERAELVVREAVREGAEARAGRPPGEPAADEPLHGRRQVLGRNAPEDRPRDRRLRAEPAAQEDVVGLAPPTLRVARGRPLEAEVADPVLGAGVRAAVEVHAETGERGAAEAALEVDDQLVEPRLRLRDREVAVRLAGAGDRAAARAVELER